MKKTDMYTGRIISLPGQNGYAFIGISSVTKDNGDPHGLDTESDIFIHKDEFAGVLKVGIIVSFDVAPDISRGDRHYRAVGAMEFVEADLLPTDEQPMPGFNALAPFATRSASTSLMVSPTPAQLRMKPVSPEVVAQVLKNKPAAGIPRDSTVPPNIDELMRAFLQHMFPSLEQFGAHFRLNASEEELSAQLEEARKDHKELGMMEQLAVLEDELNRFSSFKRALELMVQNNVVRPDSIIPIEFLPDFFAAVPVWFFWQTSLIEGENIPGLTEKDPIVTDATRYFCELFPNQNWADMFQVYNRRTRVVSQYKGDIITPAITRRIREMAPHFDYIVVMTPYHDVAGRDWDTLTWTRSIDPYIVGFKKGIPYFFILARFSDSGTFPLFTELVADTVGFLRANKGRLNGFNLADNPTWHRSGSGTRSITTFVSIPNKKGKRLGDHLMHLVDEALAAFDAGNLFDWLRGTPPRLDQQ